MKKLIGFLTSFAALAVVLSAVPAGAAVNDEDPLDLVPYAGIQQLYSTGTDRVGVVVCDDAPHDAAWYVAELERLTGPWYEFHSRDRYNPVYEAVGSIPADSSVCLGGDGGPESAVVAASHPDLTNLAFIYTANVVVGAVQNYLCPGGTPDTAVPCDGLVDEPVTARRVLLSTPIFAEPGSVGYDTYPNAYFPIHEMGHTLNWPHTSTSDPAVYDTVGDVMSGGSGGSVSNDDSPPAAPSAGTAVYNLYRSGWIDQDEVAVVSGSGGTYQVVPQDGPDGAVRMVVIPDGNGSFFTLGASPGGIHDFGFRLWEGVEVFRVSDNDLSPTPGDQTIVPLGDTPTWGSLSDPTAWDFLPHVIAQYHGAHVGDYTVEVTGRSGDAFTVQITAGNTQLPTFGFPDSEDSIFADNIVFLASAGITLGCNPPANTSFCPTNVVTRGQMASFLVRVLGLSSVTPNPFTDVSATNPHRRDIAALAEAGITRGCNPPANTLFCPDAPVTRAQMASFIARAFELDRIPGGRFVDTFDSIHDADIATIASWGITRGCNPPDNNQYCPDSPVTREQMAAFLERGWFLIPPKF